MPAIRPPSIIRKRRIFDQFFKIDEIQYYYEIHQGQHSATFTRLVLERGDSVAAVVHHQETDMLYFAEQLRIATLEKGPSWMLELPAGIIEQGESPEKTIIREVEEEIGYRPQTAEFIGSFYLSPGSSSERIFLYYCTVRDQDRVSDGGGLMAEGEIIRLVIMPVQEVFARLITGQFIDAKTLIGLQWLQFQQIHKLR